MKRVFLLSVLLLVGLLSACQDQSTEKKSKKETIVVAKMQKPVERQYYSGTLKPITMNSVLSPVAGRVAKVDFTYGQFVKKDQPLLAIDSSDLTQNFRKSISDYLQKKSAYSNSKEEFRGSKALYDAGVISRREFVNSRSQFRTNQLNYYQAQYAMEKVLIKAGVDPRSIENLTLEDTAKINQLLQRQFKQILVKSNADGIVLFPIRSSGHENNSNNKRIELGTAVKQGQLLLMVGDLHGLSTQIHINEININRIHKGMRAVVTGSAFPGIKLQAYVDSVSSQAKDVQSNNALSEFPVLIKIPHLTDEQRKIIHVGMTAKVAIVIQPKASVLLPIEAIYTKNGKPMVTIVEKHGQRKSVPVVIGFTTSSKASIVRGVKPGDKVVVPENGSS